IVCARALGRRAELEPALRGNLRALAIGPYPHPELDVRVECARAYLEPMDKTLRPIALSARPVLRFLVRVLRAETPAERNDPPDWKRVETIAWPKTRAADALVQWLADPAPYTADASWGDQNRWAERALHELGLEP
ncbi:MAG TPA: hypothetical protein PLJ12_15570, partial [Planctomycetota bacterium]|nr:hypothetical protein [Planctomycetota bacterium]